MSRLDRQIAAVRTKLTLDRFLSAWATALLAGAALALAYVVVRTFTAWRLPHEAWFAEGLLVATAAWGLVVALRRRPGPLDAATAIDERLGLHEKFSTALHARNQTDPFSLAAVLDAENAAESTTLRGAFKLHWPRAAGPAFVIALAAAMVLWLVPPRNLFASGQSAQQLAKATTPAAKAQAKAVVEKSLAVLDHAPKAAADQNAVKLAKSELQELLKKPDFDPAAAQRKALSALQDLQRANDQVQKTQTFADAKKNEQLLSKLKPEDGETGPVADAEKELAKGNVDQALQKLNDMVQHFDQMTDAQKQQAAQQMQQLAQKIQQQANPSAQQQQQQQQQLQQKTGMTQQQAQAAQQLMQQAAQGNKQAQQQLQQMAQQAMKQMNNGQGPTQQQMQQAQQAMQQMQAQANGTQQAQQLQQAALAMSQAMQQAAGQNPQQATQQQQGQSQQGQQAQSGQQPNQGQGQKPGQSQQQMQQAMQTMQQQLQQMQAAQQDANQVASAQQEADQAMQQAQDAMNGQGQGQDPNQNQIQNQPSGGKAQAKGGGGNHFGRGHTESHPAGGADVPFTTDRKTAKSETADNGRVLASSLVKSDAPKGESHAQLQQAARAAEQESADEVDTERVGREQQKVVRDYFGSMGQ